jgi:hypothetical protein
VSTVVWVPLKAFLEALKGTVAQVCSMKESPVKRGREKKRAGFWNLKTPHKKVLSL